jgi:hypothetical protein
MEPGGIFSKIYGECPVPKMMKFDGVNEGKGAGRSCWMAMNAASGNGPYICRNSRISCLRCEFYRRVQGEAEEIPDEFIARPKITF